jgi:thioredoxin reductase
VREEALGVLDRGAEGARRALLLRSWSDDVTLFAGGPAELGTDDAALLAAAGVTVEERPVAGLRGEGDALTAVAFADGTERPCRALLVPVTIHQRSPLAEQLGAALLEPGPVAAGAIEIDGMHGTREPGLLAAGDASEQMPSVANAIAAGSKAAATIVASLMTEAPEPAPAGG